MRRSEAKIAAPPCQLLDLWRDQNLQKIVDQNLGCLRKLEGLAIELRFAHHTIDAATMSAMVDEIYGISARVAFPKVFDNAYRLFLYCKQRPGEFPEDIWNDLFESLNTAKSQFVKNIVDSLASEPAA